MLELVVGLVVGALFCGLGWLEFTEARKREQLARLIAETPTSRVEDLRPQSLVEVAGKVRAQDPGADLLEAPVSGAACLYWRFVLEEEVQRTTGTGKNRKTRSVWVTRVNQTEAMPFVLDDGTGGVEVDLHGDEVGLKTDGAGRSGFLNDPSPRLKQALTRFGFAPSGLVFNKTLRWRETYLSPGDRLYALGWFDGRRITRGSQDVLIVSDQAQHEVHAGISKAARRGRFVAIGCQVLGGLAALGGVVAFLFKRVL